MPKPDRLTARVLKGSVAVGAGVVAVALSVLPASAESRVVLIGNGDYAQLPDVPQTDPTAAAAAYKAAGYRVVEGRDLPSGEIRKALADLLRADASPGPRVVVLLGRFSHSATETWFMGAEAGSESLMSVDLTGVSLSQVVDVIAGGEPRSILLLGTDRRAYATGAGLLHSLGRVDAPKDVTVIAGYTDGVLRAAQALARPGTTVQQALRQGESLRLLSGDASEAPAREGTDLPSPVAPAAEDQAAWRRATEAATPAAFREYLSKYPRGAQADEARRRLAGLSPARPVQPLEDIARPDDAEMAAWTQAKRTNSVAAYQEFLGKYPASIFAGAARGRMAEVAPAPARDPAAAAEAAMNLDRAERARLQRQLTLLTYDTGTIDGTFGPETRRAIARWQRNRGAAPTGFLTAAQVDLIRRSAGEKLARLEAAALARQRAAEDADRAYWQRHGQGGDEPGLRAYLARYPQGLHADQARDRLADHVRRQAAGAGDDVTWARSQAADTIAAYREYLGKYPRGAHAGKAQAAMARLRQRAEADRAAEAALDLSDLGRVMVEARLAQMGLEPGAADGRLDDSARRAIRRYQAARNLRVSGYLNQGTMVRLMADTLMRND